MPQLTPVTIPPGEEWDAKPFFDQVLNELIQNGAAPMQTAGLAIRIGMATVMIVWTGLKTAFSGDYDIGGIVKLVIGLGIPRTMLAFYDTPLPGTAMSFPMLITEAGHLGQQRVCRRCLERRRQRPDRGLQPRLYPAHGRHPQLRRDGFTPQEAEWIALVCLHSGLFTRDQVEVFFGHTKSTANRFIQRLLQVKLSRRTLAAEEITDARRICRIFGKAIYRELGLTNVRHRREASIEVTRRRLLSLDFVLDHPDLPWLATEQEKVACFAQLGIDPDLLPKRIYAGRANGRVRNFHIKMPVAVEQHRAVFTYIDPGMGTPSELHSWGGADHQRSRERNPHPPVGRR